jgi:hypothetical protein
VTVIVRSTIEKRSGLLNLCLEDQQPCDPGKVHASYPFESAWERQNREVVKF